MFLKEANSLLCPCHRVDENQEIPWNQHSLPLTLCNLIEIAVKFALVKIVLNCTHCGLLKLTPIVLNTFITSFSNTSKSVLENSFSLEENCILAFLGCLEVLHKLLVAIKLHSDRAVTTHFLPGIGARERE